MMPSQPTKKFIVTFSNLAILALCAAGVANNWDQSAFQLFLSTKLPQVWPYLLIYPAFLLLMPLLPRPKPVAVKTAAAPSVNQARVMAVLTALVDYALAFCLILLLNRVCRLEDGSLYPFTAAGCFLLPAAVMPLKDEIQCRVLWRKFISPHKLNSWPCSWKSSMDQLCTSSALAFLSVLVLCLSGQVSFDTALFPRVWVQIWVEAMTAVIVTEFLYHTGHRWMHEKVYFLHKKHHQGSANILASQTAMFDLFDMVLEFGAGIPLLGFLKKLLGLDYRVHFLTHILKIVMFFLTHSGNPYAVYLFNPVLDYLARTSLCHNLHHVIQNKYILVVPYLHFVSPQARHVDN